jgi:CHASE2 domain-containing sensor protein
LIARTNFGIVGEMGEAERVYLWGAILFGALAWLLAVSRRGGLAGLLSVVGMAAVCAGCDLYLVGLTALGLWLGAVGVVVSLVGMALEAASFNRRARNRA